MGRPFESAPGPRLDRAVARHIFGIARLTINQTPPYSRDLSAALQVIPQLKRDVADRKRPVEVLSRLAEELQDTRFWGASEVEAAEVLCRAALWAVELESFGARLSLRSEDLRSEGSKRLSTRSSRESAGR
jgi:hypothetical protein